MKKDYEVQSEVYRRLQNQDVQRFLSSRSAADVHTVLLKGKEVGGVPASILANQLHGREIAKEKFPELYRCQSVIYPPGINLEQSSSEATARLKAELLSAHIGPNGSIADITGGFGIDSFCFSQKFKMVDYVEPNPELAFIAAHNHGVLGATNIRHTASTAEIFLTEPGREWSAIYIDPSRRVNARKVVSLKDCEPDVIGLQREIMARAPVLLVKASPMLDLRHSIEQLSRVCRVVVVSVQQECRELLFLCDDQSTEEATITTIHLVPGGREVFEFTLSEEKYAEVTFGAVDAFLYEPNPSILKSGAFKLVASRFGLTKLDANTHLYTSPRLVEDFPGRRFVVINRVKSDAASVSRLLPERKANVMVRNYPLGADALKKKLKIKDGGTHFIIGTTALRDPVLLLAERV